MKSGFSREQGFSSTICRLALIVMLSSLSSLGPSLYATPYASGLKNQAGAVSFILNEPADTVRITWNGGAQIKDLGPLPKGPFTTNLAVTGTFYVLVVRATPEGWAQTSSDANILVNFNSPRGVAANKNPASPYFGRVYVANSASGSANSRLVGDGIYLLNADQSDAVGQGNTARTAGLDLATGTSASPYRLTVGEDGNLYICDWSDTTGNLLVTDADVSAGSGKPVLKPLGPGPNGALGAIPLGTGNTHGSIAAAAMTGSLATGDLTVFVVDEDLQTDRTQPALVEMNSLWRFDVGAGPLPSAAEAHQPKLLTPAISSASQTMDLARGPDGKLYVSDRRPGGAESGVYLVDGGGQALFSSMDASLALGESHDILADTGALAVSCDGRFLATYRYGDNAVLVTPLVNGIPDLANHVQFPAFGTNAVGRDIDFDAAGNLHVVSSGYGLYRIYSPGGLTAATTGSDGTFAVTKAGPATSTSIAFLRTLVDPVNFLPTDITNLYTVEGVVTTWVNLAGPGSDASFFIEDSTAGIAVYWPGGGTQFTPTAGDKVQVTASLTHVNGLLQLVPVGLTNGSVTLIASGEPLPVPEPLDFAWQNNPATIEAYEGRSIVVSNVFLDMAVTNFVPGASVVIATLDGRSFELRVDTNTDLVGQPKPTFATSITGVLVQSDPTDPRTSGYQLMPTRLADIVPTGPSTPADLPTIDKAEATVAKTRQLDTGPKTANAWEWSVLSRPMGSVASLSSTWIRNPTFTPDIIGEYLFLLRAQYSSGASSTGLVQCTVTTNHPPVIDVHNVLYQQGEPGFRVTVKATDPDGDWLTPTLTRNPLGIGIDLQYCLCRGNRSLCDHCADSPGAVSLPFGDRYPPAEWPEPGVYTFEASVVDDGMPSLGVSATFTVTVLDTERPPQVTAIPNLTVAEGDELRYAVQAQDRDVPPDLPLTFSLYYDQQQSQPKLPSVGAKIDRETGLITWRPSEAEGPGIYRFRVDVVDSHGSVGCVYRGSFPDMPPVFSITVAEVNTRPTIFPIQTQTVADGQALALRLMSFVADPDLPANTLTFTLLDGPKGMMLDASSGIVSWTPPHDLAGTTNQVIFGVNDNGVPPLDAQGSVDVVVAANRVPPVLAAIPDQTVSEGEMLTVTAVATDAQVPAPALFFDVDAHAPPGVAIDALSGTLTWTPTEAQGAGFYSITVTVRDDGPPP